MSSEGVEAYELTSGSTNGDKFVDFVTGSLIPVTQPFPDRHSIVIMDRVSRRTPSDIKVRHVKVRVMHEQNKIDLN